jgi:hypothetical protein
MNSRHGEDEGDCKGLISDSIRNSIRKGRRDVEGTARKCLDASSREYNSTNFRVPSARAEMTFLPRTQTIHTTCPAPCAKRRKLHPPRWCRRSSRITQCPLLVCFADITTRQPCRYLQPQADSTVSVILPTFHGAWIQESGPPSQSPGSSCTRTQAKYVPRSCGSSRAMRLFPVESGIKRDETRARSWD